jgi:hypothetical protein
MTAPSPILGHVMNIAKQLCSMMTLETESTLSVLFQNFIAETISVKEARKICYSLIKATAPIDKLHMILVKSKQLSSQADKTSEITFLPIERSRKSPRIWKEEEDIQLLTAIHKYGFENWGKVVEFVGGGRTRSQCSQRWHRVINPSISKEAWTSSEDEELVKSVQELGLQSWAKVASRLKNRSDVQARYRYFHMDRNKLMQLTTQYPNHSTIQNHTNPLFEDFPADSETRKIINFMEDLMDGTIKVSCIDLFHAPWDFSPQ